MLAVIGDILTCGVGIAISPLTVIAVVMTLMSLHPILNSVSLLLGWALGLIVMLAVFISLGAILQESDPEAANPISGAIKILLGLAMLYLAWMQWKARPQEGTVPELPSWARTIEEASPIRIFLIGVVLMTVGAPKNVMTSMAGAKTITSAELSSWQILVVVIILLAISSIPVSIPLVGYLASPEGASRPLQMLRGWLERNGATVMTVVFIMLGVNLIGKGLGNL